MTKYLKSQNLIIIVANKKATIFHKHSIGWKYITTYEIASNGILKTNKANLNHKLFLELQKELQNDH